MSSFAVFKKWVAEATFVSRPHTATKVKVNIISGEPAPLLPQCGDCIKRWELSNLTDAVAFVNWKVVVTGGDLSVVVSYGI